MSIRPKLILPLIFLAGVFLFPSSAEARRRGIFFINTGDTVKEVGKVKAEFGPEIKQAVGASEVPTVGYLHNRFGLFWLDVWTWDGKYCLYTDADNTYWEIEKAQAAELMGVAESDVSKPLFYTVPPGLVILCMLVVVFAVVKMRELKQTREHQERFRAVAEDKRYQEALKIIQERMHPEDAADETGDESEEPYPASQGVDYETAHAEAVQHLVDNGEDREEAEANLNMLVAAVVASNEA